MWVLIIEFDKLFGKGDCYILTIDYMLHYISFLIN